MDKSIGATGGALGAKPPKKLLVAPAPSKKKYFTFGLVLKWGYKQEWPP